MKNIDSFNGDNIEQNWSVTNKTTVSSAREKVSIVRTETDMAPFVWLLFTYKYWSVNQIWL